MSTVASAITAAGALRLIADHGGKAKTAADLRGEAKQFEDEALRLERIAIGASGSNRRKARSLGRARKASQHRGNAKVCRLGAKEIERKKVATVGQALLPWPVRVGVRLLFGNDYRGGNVQLDNPHISGESSR